MQTNTENSTRILSTDEVTQVSAFQELFDGVPTGSSVAAHWAEQDENLLDSAAEVLKANDANPHAFSADYPHYVNVASVEDECALQALDQKEYQALCGHWNDEV